MKTYFEVKVKYIKIDQGGFERKATEQYLVDAVSFTDAEARTIEAMQEITSGEFQVMNIKRSNISEVVECNNEFMFKAKIQFVSIDEENGKEKKFSNYLLVSGDDIDQASENLTEHLSTMLVTYTVASIVLSPIGECWEYEQKEII